MKVYARERYKLWNLIDKFVGKDIWVRCRHYDEGRYICEWFVRILGMANVYGNTTSYYSINKIDACYIDSDEDYVLSPYALSHLQNALKPIPVLVQDIDLVRLPQIDTYTTEEIVDIINQRLRAAGYEDIQQ